MLVCNIKTLYFYNLISNHLFSIMIIKDTHFQDINRLISMSSNIKKPHQQAYENDLRASIYSENIIITRKNDFKRSNVGFEDEAGYTT